MMMMTMLMVFFFQFHGVLFSIAFSLTCRAFKSGFELEPVMCQTTSLFMDTTYCPWVMYLFFSSITLYWKKTISTIRKNILNFVGVVWWVVPYKDKWLLSTNSCHIQTQRHRYSIGNMQSDHNYNVHGGTHFFDVVHHIPCTIFVHLLWITSASHTSFTRIYMCIKCAQLQRLEAHLLCDLKRLNSFLFRFHLWWLFCSFAIRRWKKTYSNRNTIAIMGRSVHRSRGFSIVRLVNTDYTYICDVVMYIIINVLCSHCSQYVICIMDFWTTTTKNWMNE